ncbi:MAG: alpha-1,2-fucosyltransferase [Flavobacteriales bacterium]
MKVVVKVNGGLGNQMFQYALGRKLAITRGAELYLDLSFFDLPAGVHTSRPFELDVFNVEFQRAPEAMLRSFERIRSSRPRMVLQRIAPGLSPLRLFHERGFPFDPAVFDMVADTYLDGHWQSEQYFNDVNEVIREDFTFVHPADQEVQRTLDRIGACNAVSLHIRRGDYVTHGPAGQFHGVCGVDYYARAVAFLRERVEAPSLFIFSDDLAWAREHLHFDLPMTFVDAGAEIGNWNDMRSMSHCEHHIIANSSFSWWGAWLNPDPDKIVVAPARWFLDNAIDSRDLVPTSWITL